MTSHGRDRRRSPRTEVAAPGRLRDRHACGWSRSSPAGPPGPPPARSARTRASGLIDADRQPDRDHDQRQDRPSTPARSASQEQFEVGRGRPQVDRDRPDDADGVQARQRRHVGEDQDDRPPAPPPPTSSGKTGIPYRFRPLKAWGSSLSRESMNWIETRSASAVLTAESSSSGEDDRADLREHRADVVGGDHLEHVAGVRRGFAVGPVEVS